ncbi:MAG TPA: 4-(cytidine 5'-diphospho)-2-C-methyl-D-erythritol kinase [Deltaproteobacteria bacterium]|nr:4-(cytidine 5'-diphospho)-2-C-methyl-D-erythritol kinase [Deltaproteobacteria bacterium]
MADTTITLLAPAKVNLFLQVIGKRPDNYHNLFSLMCPISLYDTVTLKFRPNDPFISLDCSDPNVPNDDSNLAHKAAVAFMKQRKHKIGLEISIHKQIPVAAGLGGGSSDAAAVLMGLNRYFDNLLTQDQLLSLGLSLGADVPFFVYQKPALATGVGEKLEHFGHLKPCHLLLINPGYGVSTTKIFKNLNLRLTKCKKIHKNFPFNKRGFDAVQYLCNDLETVTASLHPEIGKAKTALLKNGALGALMSGSGPTVFGLFPDAEDLGEAHNRIKQDFPEWKLYAAELVV